MAGPPLSHGAPGPGRNPVVSDAPAPVAPVSTTNPSWFRLHLWEIQSVRDILLLALVIGLIYLGHAARVVTIPMLLAMMLAYLCEPLVRAIRRRVGVSRGVVAAVLVIVAFFAVIVPVTLGIGFGAIQATKAVGGLTENVSRVQESVSKPEDVAARDAIPPGGWRTIRDFIVEAGKPKAPAQPGTPAESEESDTRSLARIVLGWLELHGTELGQGLGQRVVGRGAEAVGTAISATVGVGYVIFTALLTMFFFYFFCASWERVLEWLTQLIPENRRARATHLLGRMDRVIAGFVRGRLLIACILGGYLTFAYFLAGVPMWLVLGPLIGLCFIVPMGQVIGLPIAMLLMWLDQGTGAGIEGTSAHWAFQRTWWWIVFSPFMINAGAQVLDDYVLTPRIQGKTTDMNVPTILFASLAGGALGGVYGLLIAIPTAACVKILLQEVVWPRVGAWVRGEAIDILPIGKG